VPPGTAFNRVEIRGAAYGALEWSADGRAAGASWRSGRKASSAR
jgi:hypothetical protein